MDETARLGLPLLAAGQAQKEMTVNEALTRLDLLTQASVVAVGVDAPPAAPVAGQAWVVGPAPTGAWSGRAWALAGWTDGGWRFVAPAPGMAVWSEADGCTARWDGSAWTIGHVAGVGLWIGGARVVGARGPAIAAPAGGATIDAEARGTIAAILAALTTHGLIAR